MSDVDEDTIREALNAVYSADEGTQSYLLPADVQAAALSALVRLGERAQQAERMNGVTYARQDELLNEVDELRAALAAAEAERGRDAWWERECKRAWAQLRLAHAHRANACVAAGREREARLAAEARLAVKDIALQHYADEAHWAAEAERAGDSVVYTIFWYDGGHGAPWAIARAALERETGQDPAVKEPA